jgi:hypothetical protein
MQFLCISNLVFSRKLHTKRAYHPIFNRFLLEFFNLAQTTVSFLGQTYVENHVWAMAFLTSPNL